MRSHSANDPIIFPTIVWHQINRVAIAFLHLCMHIDSATHPKTLDLAKVSGRFKMAIHPFAPPPLQAVEVLIRVCPEPMAIVSSHFDDIHPHPGYYLRTNYPHLFDPR